MDSTAMAARTPLAGLLVLLALAGCSSGRTGSSRPEPAAGPAGTATAATRAMEVPPMETFERAVANGTRLRSGAPGPRYWQQWADYRLEAELNPVSKRLTGKSAIRYHNRSPDTLHTVYVQLLHNIFAPGSRHNTDIPWAVEGYELSKVAAQGATLSPGAGEGAGYEVNGTIMQIRLPKPLAPGGSADLEFAYRIRIPPDGAPRGGQDGEVYYVSYWYPQMAVYDDVNGWQTDQYYGNAEFYMGYGNYDVALTVPAGWLVTSTGTLTNAAEVLSGQTRARADSAMSAKEVVHVVTEADRGVGKATAAGADGKLTWRFRAENVRDVAWGTSASYLWDATNAAVGDADGDGSADTARVDAFWRPEMRTSHWDQAARYGRHSVEFLSKYLWPYPYSHMTAVDGPTSCGGMEYPMMTCIGGQWDTLNMYEVVVHEIAHMWFPMQVGSDEKRFAWMDEGFAQFSQSQAMPDFFKGYDDEAENREPYLNLAIAGGEVELMHHGDRYPSYTAYGTASYYKTATVLVALRGVLGKETFEKVLKEYGRRWEYKHPTPYDFFNTVDDVSGRDLSWFWRTWFFETWKLDQAIDTVVAVGDSLEVVVANRGRAPMPVHLVVTRSEGEPQTVEIPVSVWLTGVKRTTVRIPREPAIKTIEIDPKREFPDIDRGNGMWPR
ncbi:MAG TPA: M1 family metallopeptidase [Gemmatimonadales bacterium]|nr:M1 family metallopeptidase [Gemmatimonadales bacterium]